MMFVSYCKIYHNIMYFIIIYNIRNYYKYRTIWYLSNATGLQALILKLRKRIWIIWQRNCRLPQRLMYLPLEQLHLVSMHSQWRDVFKQLGVINQLLMLQVLYWMNGRQLAQTPQHKTWWTLWWKWRKEILPQNWLHFLKLRRLWKVLNRFCDLRSCKGYICTGYFDDQHLYNFLR